MNKLHEIRTHLRPGQVYRRSDLGRWSKAVDRDVKQLRKNGVLEKIYVGLYYCPRETVVGKAPPDEKKLMYAFLKGGRFLITSPNMYNTLGVGTTQLYNKTIVYNRKRHGQFKLGGRTFEFRRKLRFPRTLSREFLLVDLANNIEELAEDGERLANLVKRKALSLDKQKLSRAVRNYGNARTKKFFAESLKKSMSKLS
jgi:hypothetical protein